MIDTCYRPPTKLRKGNVFTDLCLSVHREVESQVPVFPEGVVGISGTRFLLGEGGWVCLGGGYVQREGVSIPPDMGYNGIQSASR